MGGQGVGQHHLTFGRPDPHYIRNTQHFMEQIKSLQLQQGECIVSYDVKALFTLVPVDCAISIIKSKLLQDLHVNPTNHHLVGVLP